MKFLSFTLFVSFFSFFISFSGSASAADFVNHADVLEAILKEKSIQPAENLSPEIELLQDFEPEGKSYLQKALNLKLLDKKDLSSALTPLTKAQTLEILFDIYGLGLPRLRLTDETFPFKDLSPDSRFTPLALRARELNILEQDAEKFNFAKRVTQENLTFYLKQIEKYLSETKGGKLNANDAISLDISLAGLEKLTEIWSLLRTDYFYGDTFNRRKAEEEAIKGLLRSVSEDVKDNYTVFDGREDAKILKDSLKNEYEGIGITVEFLGGWVRVVAPLQDSPAEKAGILAGDLIVAVDDKSVQGKSLDDVISLIKGKSGTVVKLTIRRDPSKTLAQDSATQELSFTLTRQKLTFSSVELSYPDFKGLKQERIARLQIRNFGDNTVREFKSTLKNFHGQKLILDLRNNPGGYLESALAILAEFKRESFPALKVLEKNRQLTTYKTVANPEAVLAGVEVVVLINGGSASAAEIVAGALQANKIASIVGEKSFGKGSVQKVVDFTDKTLFKYTIAKWLTPDDKKIDGVGVIPDIILKKDLDESKGDSQLLAALALFD